MNKKIALCQLLPEAYNPERNLFLMKKTISTCSKKGAVLCIFPEDFLYGILRDRSGLVKAGKKYSYWLNHFRSFSTKYNIDIIPGTFPLYNDGKLFNSTVYIDKKGNVLTQYSKTNLWLSERAEYTPSITPPKCFESALGKTVIIICWDIFDHKLFESAIRQGAEWIIVLSLWSMNQSEDHKIERGVPSGKCKYRDSKMIDAIIQTRVAEYNIGIIFCNFAKTLFYTEKTGITQRAISANRTQVISPLNQVYKRLTNKKETILFADIPPIDQSIYDFEIYYGRREDIVSGYPYGFFVGPHTLRGCKLDYLDNKATPPRRQTN